MTERAGQGARWPAVSRQRVNPATGRRPMPPTMRRKCAEHEQNFCAGPALIRGEGFADWFKRFLASA